MSLPRLIKNCVVLSFGLALCLSAEAQVHFPLDETTGFNNAVLMPGAKGNAVRLNGYTSYARKNYNAASLSTTAQTLSFWCAAETYPMMNAAEAENAWTSIIETCDDNAHTGLAVRLSSQGDYSFYFYSDGWKLTLTPSAKFPLYQWNHIVVTMDVANHQAVMYNNGVQVASGSTMNSLSGGTGSMLIGKDNKVLTMGPFMLNTFNGLIDDIRIDNAVWTAEQIAADNTPVNQADLIYPQNAFYANMLRPHFHAMPMMGWSNETHGMFWKDGKYHLFFQKNPNGPYMARLHWGHLTSTDLCGWEEQPIAVAPSASYDIKGCWSGCVFSDAAITGGQPWIAYTGVDNGRATIDFAQPQNTEMTVWTKDTRNPRINGRPAGLTDDFRDPYFFKNGDKAYMIVGSSRNGVGVTTLHRFDANGNLDNSGDLFFAGNDAGVCGTFFEMPNVTKMGNKWLFTATPLGSSSGVRTVYWVGTIDGNGHFVPDNMTPKTVELPGVAREGFGLLSPTICQTGGKTIALGIVPDKLPGQANYEMGWAHAHSLPREWTLSEDGVLHQRPYAGLSALRKATVYSATNESLAGTKAIPNVANGRQIEVDMSFVIKSGNTGVNLLVDGGKALRIYYEQAGNRLVVDMRSVQRMENDGGVFDGFYASVLPESHALGDELKLHVYLDHSVLDVFVDDKWASSYRVFATSSAANGVELYSMSTTTVTNVGIYDLETTVSPKDYPIIEPGTEAVLNLQTGNITVDGHDGRLCYETLAPTVLRLYDVSGKCLGIHAVNGKGSVFVGNGQMILVSVEQSAFRECIKIKL